MSDNVLNECTELPKDKGKKKMHKGLKITLTVLFWTVFNPVVAAALAIVITVLPVLNAYRDTFGSESVYDNVFVAELGDKYERLLEVDEPKIAVIGGSSVAFGLDSAMLSRYTGMEVVNFGLYATLGSKVMLDLSEHGLNEGDVVVFAPELDVQTLSMYFGAKSVWQAIDVNNELYGALADKNKEALIESFDAYREDKLSYLADGIKPDPAGVYNSKNFNEYGDIKYDRPYNTMALGYDPNTIFTLDSSIVSEDFLNYFNDYCERMEDKGVRVYFSFCPINELALDPATTEESLRSFEGFLKDYLACPVISSIDEYIMKWGYFYDTNLHLNEAGVTARTASLIKDLRTAEGLAEEVTLRVPEAPGKESGNELLDGDNTYMDYFLYETLTMPDGVTVSGVKIVGVTELAKANTSPSITIPTSNGELLVIQVEAGVLNQIPGLESVSFGKHIKVLDDALFEGCETLTDVYLEFGPDDCLVTTPDPTNPDGLMKNCPDGIKIHCKAEHTEDYRNHYTWAHYFKYFVTEE